MSEVQHYYLVQTKAVAGNWLDRFTYESFEDAKISAELFSYEGSSNVIQPVRILEVTVHYPVLGFEFDTEGA